MATHLFDKFIRVRFRGIRGTRQECNYQLMVMGISCYEEIPVGEDDELLLENHKAWLEKRRQKEEDGKSRNDPVQQLQKSNA